MTASFSLRDLAIRLTPNPARTVEGTLAVIIDAIDRLDEESLARALGHVGARMQGLDAQPLTDERWAGADEQVKRSLMHNSVALKLALKEMCKPPAGRYAVLELIGQANAPSLERPEQ